MERRKCVRIPIDRSVTVKPHVGRAVRGQLRDISFDGAFFIPSGHLPNTRLGGRVHLRMNEMAASPAAPVDIPARVISLRDDGVVLLFEAYDRRVNAYLEQIYAERLTRGPGVGPFPH